MKSSCHFLYNHRGTSELNKKELFLAASELVLYNRGTDNAENTIVLLLSTYHTENTSHVISKHRWCVTSLRLGGSVFTESLPRSGLLYPFFHCCVSILHRKGCFCGLTVFTRNKYATISLFLFRVDRVLVRLSVRKPVAQIKNFAILLNIYLLLLSISLRIHVPKFSKTRLPENSVTSDAVPLNSTIVGITLKIRPRPSLSSSFTIHYPLIFLTYHSTLYSLSY
jgi:hypothetical protein